VEKVKDAINTVLEGKVSTVKLRWKEREKRRHGIKDSKSNMDNEGNEDKASRRVQKKKKKIMMRTRGKGGKEKGRRRNTSSPVPLPEGAVPTFQMRAVLSPDLSTICKIIKKP